jgi:hypothetical protein
LNPESLWLLQPPPPLQMKMVMVGDAAAAVAVAVGQSSDNGCPRCGGQIRPPLKAQPFTSGCHSRAIINVAAILYAQKLQRLCS